MSDLLPFIVSGIAAGAVYGLAGTGLVLSYKTSGIFNFGYGALAAAAAYLFYWLRDDQGLSWELAFVLSVFGGGLLLGLLMEWIARHLADQSTTMKIVGTVGLIVLTQGVASLLFGPDPLRMEQYIPDGNETFVVAGTHVRYSYVVITAVAAIAVVGLYVLFRTTRIGLAMRAVVDDADLLATKGTDPVRVRRVAWFISSTFAALSGVLVAPLIGVDVLALTFLVVQAFGAAAIGRFTSIPLTFAGGIAIGIAADISKKYVLQVSWLSGLPASLPFIILFVVLLLVMRHSATVARKEARPPLEWRAPASVRLLGAIVVVAALVAIPALVGSRLPFFIAALTEVVLFLSLGLLVRTSGQISLCHAAFAGLGAVAFSQLAVDQGLPWGVALVAAAAIVVPVGAIVAIPAIRLSGVFLALATLGFGLMVERLIYPLDFAFTSYGNGRAMPRPSFAESDERYYYFVLAFVVVTAAFIVLVDASRLGRMLRGMAGAPVAMSVMGLTTNVTRVVVFCISAFLAAIAGILYGSAVTVATASDEYYSAFTSIVLIAVLTMAPFTTAPWYALFAGLISVLPAYIEGSNTSYWMDVGFGFFAVVIAMQGGPHTMPERIRRKLDRLGTRRRRSSPAMTPPASAPADRPAGSGLEVRELTVRFGGLLAVDGVSLSAPVGRITGLIGPNGAGKTTTFNACFGLNRPDRGIIELDGRDVSRLSTAERARRGLGRTFQVVQLADRLRVIENVALGREAGLAGRKVLSQLFASRRDRQEVEAATMAALELCGITHLADEQAGSLSTGERRLVELARCLAGPFHILMMDEPSSGLTADETARFGRVLQRVVEERGVGVLLVEHDMSLVMSVCSYLYVLDFGILIAEGTPEEIAANQQVRSAYLGNDPVRAIEDPVA